MMSMANENLVPFVAVDSLLGSVMELPCITQYKKSKKTVSAVNPAVAA